MLRRNWKRHHLVALLLVCVATGVAAMVTVPSALGRGADEDEILLTPWSNTASVGTEVKLTASITERDDPTFVGVQVTVRVVSGPNAGLSMQDFTDSNGRAHVTYTSTSTGTDTLQ